MLATISQLGAIVAFSSFLFAVFTYWRETRRSSREDAMRIIIHKSGSILTIENTSDIVVTDLEVSIGTGKQIEIVNASPGYIKSKEKIELDLSDERIVKQPAPAGYIHVAFTGPRGLRWVRDSDQLVKQGWIQRKMIRKRLSK